MNPKIKKRWVEALRSGNYKQIRGNLMRRQHEYDVLGVLMSLYLDDHLITDKEVLKTFWTTIGCLLPSKVVKWAGLNAGNPVVIYTDAGGIRHNRRLSELNDGICEGELNFGELADLIEAQL